MNLTDRLETLECKRDDKARRVSNVAPDTLANITANELENGVTLEALEALNVPVLRYNGQVTIHGNLPAFDPAARPGGYKAVFKNGNGSIGVRYSAIDAGKKALLERASKVSSTGWHCSKNSTTFQVSRSFYLKGNTSEEQTASALQAKIDCLAALRGIPVARFYGSAFAYVLAYGMGYGCAADIGAIPASEVWPLIRDFFGVTDEADLIAREQVKQAEQDAKSAAWQAECEARRVESTAKLETLKATLGAPLAEQPSKPGDVFRLLVSASSILTIELSGTGKRVYYTITHENGEKRFDPKRKILEKGWPKAAREGRLFPI